MGHADPFLMPPGFEPATGIRRILSGTPAILAMQPLSDMIDLLEEVGMTAVREKSVALTEYAVALADELQPLGVELGSPRDPARRGGHVTVNHPRMREVTESLWRDDVLPDYREPNGLRVGLSPLSTSFEEVRRGLEAVAEALG
jgi:kynureninase